MTWYCPKQARLGGYPLHTGDQQPEEGAGLTVSENCPLSVNGTHCFYGEVPSAQLCVGVVYSIQLHCCRTLSIIHLHPQELRQALRDMKDKATAQGLDRIGLLLATEATAKTTRTLTHSLCAMYELLPGHTDQVLATAVGCCNSKHRTGLVLAVAAASTTHSLTEADVKMHVTHT